MTQRSKSTLFLIEQLVVIAVFAICAVACISILTAAYFNAHDACATGSAILVAESGAEVFKATGGDYFEVAYLLRGTADMGGPGSVVVTVYYDDAWQVCVEADADFVLNLAVNAPLNMDSFDFVTGILTVDRITGEQLVAFPLAARREVRSDG